MHLDSHSHIAPDKPIVGEAPGWVNLIGEHTDYNGGFVLPTTIPQTTRVEVARRSDHVVRIWSATHSKDSRYSEYALGKEARSRSWLDYIQGITQALEVAGCEVAGFDARIYSTVPTGSGLSSSAALEIGLLRALREAFGLNLSDVDLARLGQQAENDFVGARVGIMDQMAASLADGTSALFLDTRNLDYRRVPLPLGADLLVIHSGITHQHASGEYNRRRSECEEACRLLGIDLLRECSVDDLPRIERLPRPLDGRARHVVTENARVLAALQAMEANNVEQLGKLFLDSHASMRDDYEVSIPEIDTLVELSAGDADVFGARMTGGGFGGSIVALTSPGAATRVGRRISETYVQRTGHSARIFVPPDQHSSEGGTQQ